jgi:hypothetical protein
MKLTGTINYFFPCEMEVFEDGKIGEPVMPDGIMNDYFRWLFDFITWLKSFAYVREGYEPMFEIRINPVGFDEYKKKFPIKQME